MCVNEMCGWYIMRSNQLRHSCRGIIRRRPHLGPVSDDIYRVELVASLFRRQPGLASASGTASSFVLKSLTVSYSSPWWHLPPPNAHDHYKYHTERREQTDL